MSARQAAEGGAGVPPANVLTLKGWGEWVFMCNRGPPHPACGRLSPV
jgi:hypothetical protein